MSLVFKSLVDSGVLASEPIGRCSFPGMIDFDLDATNAPTQATLPCSLGAPPRSVDSTWRFLTGRYDTLLRKLAD